MLKRLPLYSFLGANAISLIGNNLTTLAVPWFVLQTTGSPAKMGLVAFCTTLPAVIAGFFGGTLVDRWGYKKTSIIADLASGITVALIPLLHHTVGLEFWQLLVLVFLSALLDVPGNTARQALLPDMAQSFGVSLERTNSAQQGIHRGAMLVGPALGGALIVWLGSSNVLWLDSFTFFISATLFAIFVPSGKAKPASHEPYLKELFEGLRFIRKDRLILSLMLMVAITNFLDPPIFAVILPIYANQFYGDATSLGLIISGFGAGAVLGAVIFGIFGARLPRRITFIVSFVMVGLPIWLLTQELPLPLAVTALFITGFFAGPINPIIMTVTQERVPTAMRGRVFGMMNSLAWAVMPLGMLLSGLAVEQLSISHTVMVIATCYLCITVVQFVNPVLHGMRKKG